MRADLAVAVVGAGPYGLSIAAHLDAAGIENRIFGSTMEFWQDHMPPGMCLKSYGDSSNLFDPQASFTLEHFCRDEAIAYRPESLPVRLETFIAYGRAFQRRFVPHVEAKRLVLLTPIADGLELTFDDGETVAAKRVVLAIGVLPFQYVPPELSAHLPPELLSHSSAYGSLTGLSGRRVTIIGAGSSALDLAALMSARGAVPTIVTRASSLKYQSVPGLRPSPARRLIDPPAKGLGAGWVLRACSKSPQFIHKLPDRLRAAILSHYLGPSGGYFIRTAVEQRVAVKLSRRIERVQERAGRVRLFAVDRSGSREIIESDHVVAATGYRVDMRRLLLLSGRALDRLRTAGHAPVLSSNFESSLPGLHFVGQSSARAFGPIMRFVEGAQHPASRLLRMFGAHKLRLRQATDAMPWAHSVTDR